MVQYWSKVCGNADSVGFHKLDSILLHSFFGRGCVTWNRELPDSAYAGRWETCRSSSTATSINTSNVNVIWRIEIASREQITSYTTAGQGSRNSDRNDRQCPHAIPHFKIHCRQCKNIPYTLVVVQCYSQLVCLSSFKKLGRCDSLCMNWRLVHTKT